MKLIDAAKDLPNALHYMQRGRRLALQDREHAKLVPIRREIPEELLTDARLLPNRTHLLNHVPKGSVCAEIGTASGDYSRTILSLVQPRMLYLVDLWSDVPIQIVLDRFKAEIAEGTVQLRQGYSWSEAEKLDDQSLDFAYVDAGHSYSDVSKDLRAIAPKVKPDGMLAGHDYVAWSNHRRFGVIEAVNEFMIENHWKLKFLTIQPNMHLSYAIVRA